MTLREHEELICFAAIGEAGSLTAAANQLNCSKAHISRRLASLEGRAGTKLIHRSTRSLMLTAAGQSLLAQAREIYSASRLSNHRVPDLESDIQGSFVITAPVSIASYLLIPMLPDLQTLFPQLEFEIIPTNDNLKLIQEGVDLAIRTGSLTDDSLVATTIGSARDVFFAATDEAESIKSLEELKHHRLLINPQSLFEGRLTMESEGNEILIRSDSQMLIHEYPLLLQLVANGFGLGVAPDYCQQSGSTKAQIKRLLPTLAGPSWPVYLLHPFQTPLSRKLSSVKGFLKECLQKKLMGE